MNRWLTSRALLMLCVGPLGCGSESESSEASNLALCLDVVDWNGTLPMPDPAQPVQLDACLKDTCVATEIPICDPGAVGGCRSHRTQGDGVLMWSTVSVAESGDLQVSLNLVLSPPGALEIAIGDPATLSVAQAETELLSQTGAVEHAHGGSPESGICERTLLEFQAD